MSSNCSEWQTQNTPSLITVQANIWKFIYLNCGEWYEDMIVHRSYALNLSSSEIKPWKNFRPERDSNPWRYRCSTTKLMLKFSIKCKNKGREHGKCHGNSRNWRFFTEWLLKTWVWNVYFIRIKHSLVNKRKKKINK